MKKDTIALIIAGGCLLLLLVIIGLFYGVRKFYSRTMVMPADYRTKTKVYVPYITPADPENPVKLNIPDDFGIGHQRKDQETYHAWDPSKKREYYGPPNGGKLKKYKKIQKRRVK
jgi:hypothetical protein